jgi:hypothetical protein
MAQPLSVPGGGAVSEASAGERIADNNRRIAEIERQIADQKIPAKQPQSSPGAPQVPEVTHAVLSDWRHRIVQALARLDQTGERQPQESVAAQIGRLSRRGVIPRSVAAMIRAITEMRNAVEYEAKTLSEAESIAADANWRAIQQWASKEGLQM